MKNLYKIEDELYIVSSSEKIKENTQTFKQGLNGDWFYNTIYNFIARTGDITPYDFKIILTTNNLLIKDGVQAIDDEFLEWFIKNPSCDEVEVEKICNNCGDKDCIHAICRSHIAKTKGVDYKIIIPKAETKFVTVNVESATGEDLGKVSYIPLPNIDYIPKQDLKVGDNTNFGIITDVKEYSVCFGKNVVGVDIWYKKSSVELIIDPKQETLEEAAEKLYPYVNDEVRLLFINGAKSDAAKEYWYAIFKQNL